MSPFHAEEYAIQQAARRDLMETCFSETSVHFQRVTWRYIPEDIIVSDFTDLYEMK
jgi:hypothetical protein